MRTAACLILSLLCFQVYSQKIELGGTIGIANYTGDLAPSVALNETKWTAGVFGRYNFNNTWAFNLQANQLQISGDDQNFAHNSPRNIRFRTNVTELAGVFEFNYFKYGTGVLDKHFTPYVYWGLGLAYFDPQGFYQNQWYSLREYQTEGKSYSSVTMVMPMGLGLKYMPNKRMSWECNLGIRKTYTDYIDDVSGKYTDVNAQLTQKGIIAASLTDPSAMINEGVFQNKQGYQRGNSDFNDWYFTFNVSFTLRIFSRINCARFY